MRRLRRIITSLPSTFIVFLLNVVLAILRMPNVVKEMKVRPSTIQIVKISKHARNEGFINDAIPQLPLSLLNSVIAFYKLSSGLFPAKNRSMISALVTIGLMNLARCLFGAMPCCHGARGLAGQYKFGGRSGRSGNSWRSQVGFGIGCWEFFGKVVEPVSCRGIGSFDIVSECSGYLGFNFCFPIETL